MSVTIPSTDVQHTNFNSTITSLTTQIANAKAAGNYALAGKLTQDQNNVRFQLVTSLIGSGHLSCTSILANETYITNPVSDGQ